MMLTCAPYTAILKLPNVVSSKTLCTYDSRKRECKAFFIRESASDSNDSFNCMPAAPNFITDGPWMQIPGGVTAANGFKAAGIYGGLRAKKIKSDLALITCDVDAVTAGAFTTNMVLAAPVLYCKNALHISKTARAVLINAGQANAATGNEGYMDVLEYVDTLAMILDIKREEVLVESTGVIGRRIKKEALLKSLPQLVNSLSSSNEGADRAAVAITTTDLVRKSVALETQVGGSTIRVGGMAKGSGMIHPNMATMLGVITTDALVQSDVWRKMVHISVSQSFNQLTVDGDTSTNDTIIALASGLSGSTLISSQNSCEAMQLQASLDAVMQALAKSIAWDGEGATCLVEVTVSGAKTDADAAKVARSIASSSLVKAAVYGRDPNWGRIAAAAGSASVPFHQDELRIKLGDILLMDNGQPLAFDRMAARDYLKSAGDIHGTVGIHLSIGDGPASRQAWGCDLSYDYVRINAEYTT